MESIIEQHFSCANQNDRSTPALGFAYDHAKGIALLEKFTEQIKNNEVTIQTVTTSRKAFVDDFEEQSITITFIQPFMAGDLDGTVSPFPRNILEAQKQREPKVEDK